MMRKNFMRSGICLYSWCTVPRMKFVFCLSARGVQFGFLLKLFAWKGKVSGMSTKFVFVTGGVVSGLGKGICAASLGRLLKQRGVRVRNQKFDPYINVDPGTMIPRLLRSTRGCLCCCSRNRNSCGAKRSTVCQRYASKVPSVT